jgi:hypothetical protein
MLNVVQNKTKQKTDRVALSNLRKQFTAAERGKGFFFDFFALLALDRRKRWLRSRQQYSFFYFLVEAENKHAAIVLQF